MDTSTEEYFQTILEKVKEFEPYSEAEIAEVEKEFSIEFPPQIRQLFLKANDMVGWETSKFSLLTLSDISEIFSGEDIHCGEDFKNEDYDDLGLFPFATVEIRDYSKYLFLDTNGDVSDAEGAVIWQDRSGSLDPDYVVLENNLAEFLDGVVSGTNYHERVVEFIDETDEATDED
jgi:hypothetical protein